MLDESSTALNVEGSNERISRAVIAVPAYFNPSQCEATKRAGELAGLERVSLLKEPEAAALAYGLGRGGDELVLVSWEVKCACCAQYKAVNQAVGSGRSVREVAEEAVRLRAQAAAALC